MSVVELLERSAPEKLGAVARGPEGDLGAQQSRDVEGVPAVGRGGVLHVGEVFFEEARDLRIGRIVHEDPHCALHYARLACPTSTVEDPR
nr:MULTISPECIES: hypothetical protein [Actinopolyspora]